MLPYLIKPVTRALYGRSIAALQRLLDLLHRIFNLAPKSSSSIFPAIRSREDFFRAVNRRVGLVASAFDLLFSGDPPPRVHFRDHAASSLCLPWRGRCSAVIADFLFLACAHVLGAYVQYAVGINVKGDFNLRSTPLVEQAECRSIGTCRWFYCPWPAGAVTLQHIFVTSTPGWIVAGCGEKFPTFTGGDRRVALDQLGVDTPPTVFRCPAKAVSTSSSTTFSTSPFSTPP